MFDTSTNEEVGTAPLVYIPQNDSTDTREVTIITREQIELFILINQVFISGFIGLLGIISNVINMIIFYRQGLDTTINISFFSMSLSDMLSIIFQIWYIICDIPYFVQLELPMVYYDLQFLFGGIPREAFARITCFITAYVTAERCLCIAFPLHIKQIVTPERTTALILFFFFATWGYGVPLYCMNYLDWRFNPDLNRSLLGMMATPLSEAVNPVIYFTHAAVGVLSMVAVAIFTFILILKLGQTSAWRNTVKSHRTKADSMTKRDRATMNMVVLIACILIVCYTPAVTISVTTFCLPEFSVGGKYFSLYYIMWSFAFLFETINSSVNIFLYYKMSSRFRQIFRVMFFGCGLIPKSD